MYMLRKPSLASIGAIAALSASAIASCNDEAGIRKLADPAVQIDELKQKPAALVDILWIVDNSGSTADKQQLLGNNFDKFITGLTSCPASGMANDQCDFTSKKCTVSGAPCNPPDYHIGVVTTDVHNAIDQGKLRRVGLCVPSVGATPSGGKYRYCEGTNVDCVANAMDPASDPANSVCDMTKPVAFVTPTTPGASNAFKRIVRVGDNGSADEQGIRGAAMAVGRDTNRMTGQWIPAPAENKDFFRADASLFLIFVSDENDNSFGEPTYFYRAFESLKGAGNEGLISISAIVGDPDPDGPMGAMPGGCPAMPIPNKPSAHAGTRYIALSMYSRGQEAEFRACDNKRLLCSAGEHCQAPVPDLPGICVSAASCMTDQDCGNFKCGDAGCVTCASGACNVSVQNFVLLLQRTGVFGSICSEDYSQVLSALGYEAAGLRRKFELTKNADCTQKVKCCDMGVDDMACKTETPMCVKVNGAPIPNDRATGWVYEASSNAVFFDGSFVPPTDASVTVSYKLSRASTPLSCTTALK
jgi:hypothetical protein